MHSIIFIGNYYFIDLLFKELESTNETIQESNIKALITFGKFNKSDFIELLINQSLPFNK